MNKKQIIDKIVNDLPMSDMLGKMTKEEWHGWFEECWDKAIDFTHCSTQLKGDKYTQAFNDYVDRFFKYRPKVYQWVSKDGKREFTHKQLCKYYTKAMNESPFIV